MTLGVRIRTRTVVALGIGLLLMLAATRTLPAHRSGTAPLSDKDKVSYALGMTFATQVRAQSIDVDPDVVARAFEDAFADRKTLLTDREARSVLGNLQKELKSKRAAMQREKMKIRARSVAEGGSPARLALSFKLDPRMISGVYGGGDRWVSPSSYTKMGEGSTCTVEVRTQNAAGDPVVATWTTADPEMVQIQPNQGTQVKLVVQRAGDTHVHVVSDAGSNDLTIKASYVATVLKAEISQP